MSSIAAAAPNLTDAASRLAPATYWCHQCDGSVTIHRSSPPLVCPQCRGDFLEEMELQLPLDPPPPRLQPQTLSPTDSDDDLYFHPAARHPPSDGPFADQVDLLVAPLVGGPSPASKASVDAIPTLKFSASVLAADPLVLCAVCKDEFALDSEGRQLPCSHIYHSDCILPWLSHHNTCPVCRFQLPTDDGRRRGGDHGSAATEAFWNMLEEDEREADEDEVLHGLTGTLMRLARMQRFLLRRDRLVGGPLPALNTSGASSTQMAQEEMGPANSGETVSSGWPVDGRSGTGGVVGGTRADDDGDVVMSDLSGTLLD